MAGKVGMLTKSSQHKLPSNYLKQRLSAFEKRIVKITPHGCWVEGNEKTRFNKMSKISSFRLNVSKAGVVDGIERQYTLRQVAWFFLTNGFPTGLLFPICENEYGTCISPYHMWEIGISERFHYLTINDGDPTHCWGWRGHIKNSGYGFIRFDGDEIASRVSYRLHKGQIPKMDCHSIMVCHTCDNPLCCNPAHLYLGTQTDNVNDAKARHRFDGRPLFAAEQVLEMRKYRDELLENGSWQETNKQPIKLVRDHFDLGPEYASCVGRLLNGITWKSLLDMED